MADRVKERVALARSVAEMEWPAGISSRSRTKKSRSVGVGGFGFPLFGMDLAWGASTGVTERVRSRGIQFRTVGLPWARGRRLRCLFRVRRLRDDIGGGMVILRG